METFVLFPVIGRFLFSILMTSFFSVPLTLHISFSGVPVEKERPLRRRFSKNFSCRKTYKEPAITHFLLKNKRQVGQIYLADQANEQYLRGLLGTLPLKG